MQSPSLASRRLGVDVHWGRLSARSLQPSQCARTKYDETPGGKTKSFYRALGDDSESILLNVEVAC